MSRSCVAGKASPRTSTTARSKDFLEAGKKQLAGDTVREATSHEVKGLRSENRELKEVVAEITLKNRVLKKSLVGYGEEEDA